MEQAKADLTRAAALARRVAAMEPKQLTSALFGLDMDRRAQRSLAETLRASGDVAGAEQAAARAEALASVIKAAQEEARSWSEQPALSTQDMRERETKLVEKALALAQP